MIKKHHVTLLFIALAFFYPSHHSIGASSKESGITIEIKEAWIRYPIEGTMSTSLYFQIYNSSLKTDYLIKVESDIADSVQINKTVRYNGILKTIEVEKVALPSKTEVKFEPMGIYLLINDFKEKITKGTKIKFKLIFANSSPLYHYALVK